MKKRIILFLLGLFFTTFAFAQLWHEGVVEGNEAKYLVVNSGYEKFEASEGRKMYVSEILENDRLNIINLNSDTTAKKCCHKLALSLYMVCQIQKILNVHLSSEELLQLTDEDDMRVFVRVDSAFGGVSQVSFEWKLNSFWMNFSPDRLYRFERDILAQVKLPDLPGLHLFHEVYGSEYDVAINVGNHAEKHLIAAERDALRWCRDMIGFLEKHSKEKEFQDIMRSGDEHRFKDWRIKNKELKQKIGCK